ncbi:MAG: DNA methyltransferase [Chloroflexota bacterium]
MAQEQRRPKYERSLRETKAPKAKLTPQTSIWDPRNRLNDLTGREWVHFLSSVDATAYPTTGPQSYGHNLRRIHPSPKPPQLMAKIVEFFTRRGEWVLDPFMGVGGTLLGCSLAERNAVGVDLSADYIETYHSVATQEGLPIQTAIAADSRQMLDRAEVAGRRYDMVLTDPPYGDMMRRPQNGEKKKKTGDSSSTPFTASTQDLGNLHYPAFLDELTSIMSLSLQLLKPSGYMVIFAKDLQPTAEHHNMLHADLVIRLSALDGLLYRGCKIWYDQTPRLYPFGYPYRFVANQLHQYILIFQKT